MKKDDKSKKILARVCVSPVQELDYMLWNAQKCRYGVAQFSFYIW